jgi:hypothetical protein
MKKVIKPLGVPVVFRKGHNFRADAIKAALRKVSTNPALCEQEFREMFASWSKRLGEAETLRIVEQALPHGRGRRQSVRGWREDRVIELMRELLPDPTNEAFAKQMYDASQAGKVKYYGSAVRFQSAPAVLQRLKRLRRRGT